MRVDIVFNPFSGRFRETRLAQLERAFETHGARVRSVGSPRGWQPDPQGTDIVCVHGGDGTLRDVVQALGPRAGAQPLCIAPSGTINLVARELGYARDPRALANQVCAAWERGPTSWVRAPLYALGDMPVVACLSIGADSHAVATVSPELKKRFGRMAYAIALARQLRRWPRSTLDIAGELADGQPFACQAEAVIASHGALYAGPFRLSPRAALAADSIELLTLRRSTRLGTLALTLAALLRLPLDRLGLAEIRTVRRVIFDRCVSPVQVDGDHMPDCAYAIGPTGMSLQYVV